MAVQVLPLVFVSRAVAAVTQTLHPRKTQERPPSASSTLGSPVMGLFGVWKLAGAFGASGVYGLGVMAAGCLGRRAPVHKVVTLRVEAKVNKLALFHRPFKDK